MLFNGMGEKKRLKTIVGGIALGSVVFWIFIKASKPVVHSVCTYVLSDNAKKGGRSSRVVNVEVEVLKPNPMTRHITSVGETQANAYIKIRSEINGVIEKVHFVEGAFVKKDEILITLKNAEYVARVHQAQAEYNQKKADFSRVETLFKKNIANIKEFDKEKAEFEAASARLEVAKVDLEKTYIRAAFDGKIGLLNKKSVGSYVQIGDEIVVLVDESPIKVLFKVPEKHLHDVGVGQTVEIKVDPYKDRIFYGTVEAVEPVVEHESHSFLVRSSLPNEDGVLRPGLFADISLVTGEKGDVLSVPEAALDRDGSIEFVWIVDKGKATRAKVITGVKENGRVEIISGLKAGMTVVVVGQMRLGDGYKVKITNLPEPSGL